MDLGLKGKIAMVGGASKGLGLAVARALAGEGAHVCIASRDTDAINRAADDIRLETGERPLPVAADLSSAAAIAAWHAATMQQFGGVDLLFANTNLALSNVLRSGVTSLAKTLSVDLAPQRIRVNTLIPGRIATDRLRQLDEISARKLDIPLQEHQARAAATIPLGRYGAPDDFGRVGAFLLSEAASYITGASVQVDGGLIKGLF